MILTRKSFSEGNKKEEERETLYQWPYIPSKCLVGLQNQLPVGQVKLTRRFEKMQEMGVIRPFYRISANSRYMRSWLKLQAGVTSLPADIRYNHNKREGPACKLKLTSTGNTWRRYITHASRPSNIWQPAAVLPSGLTTTWKLPNTKSPVWCCSRTMITDLTQSRTNSFSI